MQIAGHGAVGPTIICSLFFCCFFFVWRREKLFNATFFRVTFHVQTAKTPQDDPKRSNFDLFCITAMLFEVSSEEGIFITGKKFQLDQSANSRNMSSLEVFFFALATLLRLMTKKKETKRGKKERRRPTFAALVLELGAFECAAVEVEAHLFDDARRHHHVHLLADAPVAHQPVGPLDPPDHLVAPLPRLQTVPNIPTKKTR